MTTVNLGANKLLSAGDEFYETLLTTHKDLNDEQSARLNAILVLILANQVGDITILKEALERAKKGT